MLQMEAHRAKLPFPGGILLAPHAGTGIISGMKMAHLNRHQVEKKNLPGCFIHMQHTNMVLGLGTYR
jgi:hypothetical protein